MIPRTWDTQSRQSPSDREQVERLAGLGDGEIGKAAKGAEFLSEVVKCSKLPVMMLAHICIEQPH